MSEHRTILLQYDDVLDGGHRELGVKGEIQRRQQEAGFGRTHRG
jgi:hypothetical protein